MSKVTQDELWADLKTRDRDLIRSKYGSVMAALSHGLRGAIVAAPGKQLYVADYASIEARVLLWLAGDTEALRVFERGEDIYCYMADDIYGYTTNKHDHVKERSIGKIAVLGLGYQMGAPKFVTTCALGGVEMPLDSECVECGKDSTKHHRADHDFVDSMPDTITAVKVVNAYRTKFWRVKAMWQAQETAAVMAVLHDEYQEANRCGWFMEEGFLYCELPSGRRLAYPEPQVEQRRTSWGALKDTLTFMGKDTYSHQWQRLTTYGGMLTENIVQAVARDLMAEAMLRCERSKTYTPVLTVHDELIAEARIGTGDVKEFEALMATCPSWADGCPVEAEGWRGGRYHK